jgi:7-carboxy-7-deazaguanine synthase
MAIPDILNRLQLIDCGLVEVTGGEPLIQEETPELITRLIDHGYRVLLETNGSQDISRVDNRCIKIVDFKCPSSGESDSNDLTNVERLTEQDEVKCVIADREDYIFAREIARRTLCGCSRANTIHFSPVFGLLEPKQLTEWILEDRLRVRLNLQLQKIIWSPDRRGV